MSASTALIFTPGVMKIWVKPLPGCTMPSSVETVSSVRTLVVPTQTMRPPRARAALIGSRLFRRDLVIFAVHMVVGHVFLL